jgi:hypothetical protein
MKKLKLAGSTAIGIVIGAVVFNSLPAFADLPVIDPASILQETGILNVLNTINGIESDVSKYTNEIFGALGDNTYGTVQQLLQEGFTQNANYAKAQVGAQQQITDASNMAMARFHRDMRNAQIRDEQTVSPNACTALDGGVSTQAAAVQAYDVAWTIGQIHDQRGEASPGMPSYYGQAQGVASMANEHLSNYCDQNDVAAGLGCTLSMTPDADQQFASLFGSGTYTSQTAVNTAKDYAINLIEPVAPAALRGDQLASTQGQDAAVRRRSFNARMSLAQNYVDQIIGMNSPSVPLTAQQQQYLQDMGLPAQQTGSWFQALQIEAERRISDVNWAATLQGMPPATVNREIAIELALNNYLQFQLFKTALQTGTISATQLAQTAEHDFSPTVQMPTPSIASGN